MCGQCELDKVPVGGICCFEGSVNDNGECQDSCSPERPIIIHGVCGRCELNRVPIGGICCLEGQVNDNGECRDSCTPPLIEKDETGVCGNPWFMFILHP